MRLIPAQYVKPYVKTNKSDYIDAEAIAEAVGRPTMRFVPIKSDDQLDLQSLHRVRERWVMRRTAVINQIRGLLLERGITLRKGRCHVEAALPGILEDADQAVGRIALAAGATEVGTGSIGPTPRRGRRAGSEDCARERSVPTAGEIPGIGPVTATAVVAAIGNGAAFRKGESSQPGWGYPASTPPAASKNCWESANAGTPTCEDCSCKVHVLSCSRDKQSPGLKVWLAQLTARTHHNVAGVALANKLARMAWAVLARRPIGLSPT